MKPIFSKDSPSDQPQKNKYLMPCFGLIILVLSIAVFSLSRISPKYFESNMAAATVLEEIAEASAIGDAETYLSLFQSLYAALPGAEAFLEDAATWKYIIEVKIDNTEYGILVSVLATKTGDSLHPYFGFFRKEGGEVVEIVWSGVTTGKFESAPETTTQKYMAAAIVNTGKLPWFPRDNWKNDSNDEDLVLVANDDAETILPGESGTFVYRSTNELLVPHNMTRGFLINIEDHSKLPPDKGEENQKTL